MIFINRNGLRWFDAPKEYGLSKSHSNRWKRWSDKGIFARMMDGLASEAAVPKTVMIDTTYLKAHRTASSLWSKKGGRDQWGRLIGRTKGGMNTKLHAVTDGDGLARCADRMGICVRSNGRDADRCQPRCRSTQPRLDGSKGRDPCSDRTGALSDVARGAKKTAAI